VSLSTNADTGAQTLTVTGDFEGATTVDGTARFTIPVAVQVGTVPAQYELGNALALKASRPRNPKVTSVTAGNYNEADKTITYKVVVEAESDIDSEDTQYPVTIADLTAGDTLHRHHRQMQSRMPLFFFLFLFPRLRPRLHASIIVNHHGNSLHNDANQSIASFVDNALHGFFQLQPCFLGHM
jgi:hypothetical protein